MPVSNSTQPVCLCLSQAQTALCPSPPPRPSGSCRASSRRLSLWVGRPTRRWSTRGWCGWWGATPSTTPTTTWSSSKRRLLSVLYNESSSSFRVLKFLFLGFNFATVHSYNLESSTWDVVPVSSGPAYRYGHSLALHQVQQLQPQFCTRWTLETCADWTAERKAINLLGLFLKPELEEQLEGSFV